MPPYCCSSRTRWTESVETHSVVVHVERQDLADVGFVGRAETKQIDIAGGSVR